MALSGFAVDEDAGLFRSAVPCLCSVAAFAATPGLAASGSGLSWSSAFKARVCAAGCWAFGQLPPPPGLTASSAVAGRLPSVRPIQGWAPVSSLPSAARETELRRQRLQR